jgi:hypothetical protein
VVRQVHHHARGTAQRPRPVRAVSERHRARRSLSRGNTTAALARVSRGRTNGSSCLVVGRHVPRPGGCEDVSVSRASVSRNSMDTGRAWSWRARQCGQARQRACPLPRDSKPFSSLTCCFLFLLTLTFVRTQRTSRCSPWSRPATRRDSRLPSGPWPAIGGSPRLVSTKMS